MLKNRLYRYGNENGRVPAHLNFAKEVFDNMLQHKDITALINADTEECVSYGELAQMTADVAISLTRMGVGKGEVACICSERNFEFLPTVVGIMCAGATFAPLDPTFGNSSLLHRVKTIRPKLIFCSRSTYNTHKATFDEVGSIQHYILYGNQTEDGAVLFKDFLTERTELEDFQPVPVNGWEDVALIVYSSGTTGLPKGVPVTHLGFLLNSQTILTDEGVYIYISREFYYCYGLMYSLACLRVGAIQVYSPSGRQHAILAATHKYKIKILQLAPMIVTEMIKSTNLDQYDLSSVEYIVTSSTSLREEAVLAIKEKVPNLVSVLQIYGMSEGGSVCNELHCPQGPRPGSCGVPCYGYVIKVVDLNTGEPLGPNQRGEICIKGPSVMKAYVNNVNPECKDKEGFLRTGDLGYYDTDGYFYIVNRIKELIKYNDMSVAPAELEALLLQHPAVREAGVVGKPHPQHGQVPVAFVVLQPGSSASEEQLVRHVGVQVRLSLAGGVRFVQRLPRGAGDKLDRRDLMQRLLHEDP